MKTPILSAMLIGFSLLNPMLHMISPCVAEDAKAASAAPDVQGQLRKDSSDVNSFQGDVNSAKKLLLQLKQRWQQSDPQTYVGLSVELARRLKSIDGDIQALRLESRKIASDLITQGTVQQNLRLRVFCMDVLAGLPYDTREGVYSEANRFEEAKQFLLVGQELNRVRGDLSTRTPLPPVDLSKYNWGNQVTFAGMNPALIKDPVLRDAYKSALKVRGANRELARTKVETDRLSQTFLRAFDTFAQAFHAESAEDKAKLKAVLAGFDTSVGEPYNFLKAKAEAP